MNQEHLPHEPTQAELNAERAYNAHAAEWDEMIAERNFEVAQTEDQAVYDSSRLYKDANGSIHDPDTHKFVSADAYHDAKRDEHYDESLGTSYEEMNPLELARELAKAELSQDRTKTETLTDILLDKVAAQAEKTSNPNAIRDNDDDERIARRNREIEISEKLAEKHGESNDPQMRLLDKVINYKEKYKQSLSAVTGQTEQEAKDQAQAEETRSKIDYDKVDGFREYLNKDGAPISDILKDTPAEAFIGDKTEDEFIQLLPDSYKNWVKKMDKNPVQETSDEDIDEFLAKKLNNDRVDKELATDKWETLKQAGVPKEILSAIPDEYFYNKDDRDFTDDEGEVFNKWLNDNPEVHERLTKMHPALVGKIATKIKVNMDPKTLNGPEQEQSDNAEDENIPEDLPRLSVWGRIKDRWNRQAAVTFDKSGNAIVNEELAGVDIDKKGMIALGVGALAIAAAIVSHKLGGPSVTDLWPSGGDTSPANELHNNKPQGGGVWGNNLLDKFPGGSDATTPATSHGVEHAQHLASPVLDVAKGQGFENSLQEQYGLTDIQARQAYNAMEPYLRGSDGVYAMGNDLGISQAGSFELNEQARHALEQYLQENNL